MIFLYTESMMGLAQEITLWRKGEKTRKNLQTSATSPQLPPLMTAGTESFIPAQNHTSDPKNPTGTIEDMKRDMDEEEHSSNLTVPAVGDACSTNLTADGMDE